MTGLLFDTHIWLYYLEGSSRLPPQLRRDIAASKDELWLSPLSVWEAGRLIADGRVQSEGTFREWLDESLRSLPLNEATAVREVAVVANEVELPHGDPVDHLLAATAMVYGLTLVTFDRHLKSVPGLRTRNR